MRYYFFLLICFISDPSYGQIQISGTVTDKSTGNPVPYASIFVKGQDKGTTADLNGLFRLPQVEQNTLLVISAIGYETLEVNSKEQMNIELLQKVYELPEVSITPKKHKEKLIVINSLKKVKRFASISTQGGAPEIITKFFAYNNESGSNLFIHQVRILTRCKIDSATFNLRLIAAQPNGQPGVDLLNKNLIITAKKGDNLTPIDLQDYNLVFPEYGLFVAYEFLSLEQNYSLSLKSPVPYMPFIEPMLGLLRDEDNNETWRYWRGSWNKTKMFLYPGQTITAQPAIELTLKQ